MATYIIKSVEVDEANNFDFAIRFKFNDIDLITSLLPRTYTLSEIENKIKEAIEYYVDAISEDNFALIKNTFAGKKELTIG